MENACCSSESYCWSVRLLIIVYDCVLWFVSGVMLLLLLCGLLVGLLVGDQTGGRVNGHLKVLQTMPPSERAMLPTNMLGSFLTC